MELPRKTRLRVDCRYLIVRHSCTLIPGGCQVDANTFVLDFDNSPAFQAIVRKYYSLHWKVEIWKYRVAVVAPALKR